jgi:hypothetical protein
MVVQTSEVRPVTSKAFLAGCVILALVAAFSGVATGDGYGFSKPDSKDGSPTARR